MPQEPDIEAVVKGLKPAWREALVAAKRGFCEPKDTLSVRVSPVTEGAFRRRDLMERWPSKRLTPFGQRVAAYVKEQSNAG